MNKNLQLNVYNQAQDSNYSQAFMLTSGFSDDKFQEDCHAWYDWIVKNRKRFENDDALAEEYWVTLLGYELNWTNPHYDFEMNA